MIPASPSTFSSPSCIPATPEVPRDTSHSHVPLGLHVIHPCALLCIIPRKPISCPHWVQLQESPLDQVPLMLPDEPESSADLQIDAAAMDVTGTWGRKPASSGLPTDWGKSWELAHHLELKYRKYHLCSGGSLCGQSTLRTATLEWCGKV